MCVQMVIKQRKLTEEAPLEAMAEEISDIEELNQQKRINDSDAEVVPPQASRLSSLHRGR